MAKKDRKIEEYLAPWEVDKDGKKLDEPADIDPAKLKQYLFNLLGDKEELQEKVTTLSGERDTAIGDLATLRQEHENDDDRRKREAAEQEQRLARYEADALERRKVEAIEEHFAEQGITAARARRLAKRIGKDVDEANWVKEAEELVEDGFRVAEPKAKEGEEESADEEQQQESFGVKPRVVRRSNGERVPDPTKKKYANVSEELNELIPPNAW